MRLLKLLTRRARAVEPRISNLSCTQRAQSNILQTILQGAKSVPRLLLRYISDLSLWEPEPLHPPSPKYPIPSAI